MIIPGFLDRYLAGMGYDAQETRQNVQQGRRDNLLAPAPGLHRIRGSFGKEAASSTLVLSGGSARIGIAILCFGVAFAIGCVAGWAI